MAAFVDRIASGELPALISLGLALGGLAVIACLCWSLGHGAD